MSRQKPVVVGSINTDLVSVARKIPAIGETVIGTDFQIHPGGNGANQAVAVARLGYPVQLIGRLGDDAFGAQLRAYLETAGGNIERVAVSQGASGVAVKQSGLGSACRMNGSGSMRRRALTDTSIHGATATGFPKGPQLYRFKDARCLETSKMRLHLFQIRAARCSLPAMSMRMPMERAHLEWLTW